MRKLLSFFLLLLLLSCGSSNNDKDFLSDKSLSVGEKLQRVITSDYLASWKLTSEQINWLQAFYKSQNHQPVFMKDSALSKTGKVFLEETHHFLWYGLPEGRRLKMPENLTEIEKEVWLTLQLSTLINDLKTGCFSFDTKTFKPLKPADLSTVKTVLNRFKKEKINTVLLEVGPKDSTYYNLASQNYNFCKKYGTDSTSFSMKTQKEDSIDVWKKVRTVLSQKFKLDENSDSISTYKALNEYQLMNGLDPDGKLGRNTVKALNESYITELTPEQEKQIDEAIDRFVNEYLSKGKTMEDLQNDIMNEGFIGSILGGLAGFALGSSVGKIIARVLGVGPGILYDMLTSRLVGAALGSALGSRI